MNKKFAKLAAMVPVILILVLPGALSAGERRGADLVITLKDGPKVTGELIAVKTDSLLLLAGKDESVDLVGIRSIRIVRKSKALKTLLGGACGFFAGAVGTSIYAKTQKGVVNQAVTAAGAGLLFLPGGLGIGILAGSLAGKDKTIQLEGKSESEVRQALAYLRGKARIRDYK
jgi:hypothetical protein